MPFESHVKRVRVDLSAVTRQATQLRCGCRRAGLPVVVELISVPLLLVLVLKHLGRFAVVFVELLEGFLELRFVDFEAACLAARGGGCTLRSGSSTS